MTTIRYCRGFAFYMLNDYDKALNDFDFCLSEGFNNDGSVFLYAGIIYSYKGIVNKACSFFGLAIRNGNSEAQKYWNEKCKLDVK